MKTPTSAASDRVFNGLMVGVGGVKELLEELRSQV